MMKICIQSKYLRYGVGLRKNVLGHTIHCQTDKNLTVNVMNKIQIFNIILKR